MHYDGCGLRDNRDFLLVRGAGRSPETVAWDAGGDLVIPEAELRREGRLLFPGRVWWPAGPPDRLGPASPGPASPSSARTAICLPCNHSCLSDMLFYKSVVSLYCKD